MVFTRSLAPLVGFRTLLVHAYVQVDWDEVYTPIRRVVVDGRRQPATDSPRVTLRSIAGALILDDGPSQCHGGIDNGQQPHAAWFDPSRGLVV
jgi:hypothetical protein